VVDSEVTQHQRKETDISRVSSHGERRTALWRNKGGGQAGRQTGRKESRPQSSCASSHRTFDRERVIGSGRKSGV